VRVLLSLNSVLAYLKLSLITNLLTVMLDNTRDLTSPTILQSPVQPGIRLSNHQQDRNTFTQVVSKGRPRVSKLQVLHQ
jgi:hypothetical protein